MAYRHEYLDGGKLELDPGKVVCVGRNYLDHVRELNNPVPETPLLFMKPATALVGLQAPLHLPRGRGRCHHEVELAVLIGQPLSRSDAGTARQAVAGYAIALDLTLRDLQDQLKRNGHPWEMAKAFDGSCPISPFLRPESLPDSEHIELSLTVNGEVRQHGNTGQMMIGIFALISLITQYFTLLPGDLVLTGTPAGVGDLHSGDELVMTLAGRYPFTARVI